MPQIAAIKSVPAPVGGVNARDSLAEMPETDCVISDNWFGTPSYLQVRNGNITWATGLPGAVETIMSFNGSANNISTRKLFAVSNNNIYDITAEGAAGAAVVSGTGNSRLQHQLFNSGSGTILIWVNGAVTPQYYNVTGTVNNLNALAGGSGYATGLSGSFTNVPLTGGTGSGTLVTVTVTTGVVTAVVLTTQGNGYTVGDVLTTSNTNLGGTGSGFSIHVATTSTGWTPVTMTGTGLTVSNLITVTVYQQRCWFVENNSMNVWYTDVQAFQGTVTKLPLGGLFKLGGYLMQMATWTVDNVSGMNDYAAFITSEGEVAIYQGNDPNFQSTWGLVGVFRIGRPIGRRCYTKIGSDLAIITADGVVPLSKAMLTDRTQQDINLTYKILNAINTDVASYSANFGWQVVEYPLGNKLIVNVPEVSNQKVHQWVMNSVTKSWWRFQNWNANCWELQQDSLYYGGNQKVYLADTGTSDSGMAITWDCKPAFSYFDKPGQLKQWHMARPIFLAGAAIQPRITLNIDFNDVINPSPPFTSSGGSPWNTSAWNTTLWGGSMPTVSIKNWIGVGGLGYVASGRLSGQTAGIAVQWYSTDYSYTVGGPL